MSRHYADVGGHGVPEPQIKPTVQAEWRHLLRLGRGVGACAGQNMTLSFRLMRAFYVSLATEATAGSLPGLCKRNVSPSSAVSTQPSHRLNGRIWFERRSVEERAIFPTELFLKCTQRVRYRGEWTFHYRFYLHLTSSPCDSLTAAMGKC